MITADEAHEKTLEITTVNKTLKIIDDKIQETISKGKFRIYCLEIIDSFTNIQIIIKYLQLFGYKVDYEFVEHVKDFEKYKFDIDWTKL